ncbi:MAG TPA: 2-oxoacid:acceptor oxidoreductase family protein [Acidimicrobiales bacterium]|nr:2-oxoacid:acceptor oxidoreductase family protein [Acidimicrobiales bacterium]
MATTEIKIGGFGGQGVILAGMIIGKAAALYDKKDATLTQAFGPEARGSACSAQVIVDDGKIMYPYVTRPDIMVSLSQDAYNRFGPELKEDGTLIIEQDLVKTPDLPKKVKVYGVPATRIAEELGRKMVLNVVVVGFFAAVTKLINVDAMRQAVKSSVPAGTEELNLKAFDRGYQYGLEHAAAGA